MTDKAASRPIIAEALGVSTATLERDTWLRKGIPVVRLGRQIRYRKRDVDAHTDRHSAREAETPPKVAKAKRKTRPPKANAHTNGANTGPASEPGVTKPHLVDLKPGI